MRKITREAVEAFMNCRSFKKNNTSIVQIDGSRPFYCFKKNLKELECYTNMVLHGNIIATRYQYKDGSVIIEISNSGWFSNTTKDRLNGIPGVYINQKKGVWYLNGKEWDGSWITIG